MGFAAAAAKSLQSLEPEPDSLPALCPFLLLLLSLTLLFSNTP